MQIRAMRFNPQIFLELLCHLTFGALMAYLLGTGKYLSYITPRMKPYLVFSAVVMGIWGLAALGRLFRPQHRVRSMHCLVLALPILLILLPHSPLNTADISGGYIGGNVGLYGTAQQPVNSGLNTAPSTQAPDRSTEAAIPNAQTGPVNRDDAAGLSGLDTVNKKITVSNDEFGLWVSEIYTDIYMNHMEKYEGYQIVMTGFVLKDPKILGADEFVPARLTMSCCVADLAPTGLLCKYDKVSELEKDSWVTVEGILYKETYEYDGQKYDEAQIKVTNITPAEEVEGYVYLY